MSTALWHAWERTVAENPGAVALVDANTGDKLTRGELHLESEKLAQALSLPEGRVVAFTQPNGPGWFRLFLATQKAGAIALPMDEGLPMERRPVAARELGAAVFIDLERTISLAAGDTEAPGFGPDVCLLKLTSGTTAAPRPLPFTSTQMLSDGRQVCAGMGIKPEDVNFGAIPFGHSYGLGNLVLPLLSQGSAVAFSVETLPGSLAAGIARTGATVLPTVPAVWRALTESPTVLASHLSGLRVMISAGAFLRPEVAKGFYAKFTKLIKCFYGSTETGGICFDPAGEATLSGRSVGKPLPGVQVDLEATTGGGVRVTSPAVTAPGTHLLADRGEWNPEGELRLLGRAGAVANVGGRKVDPAEVERVLRVLPGVADAWVGVRSRPSGDGYLVAAVETGRSRGEILTLLSERLAQWQLPRQMIVMTLLPRTARGKLDRENLEARFG